MVEDCKDLVSRGSHAGVAPPTVGFAVLPAETVLECDFVAFLLSDEGLGAL